MNIKLTDLIIHYRGKIDTHLQDIIGKLPPTAPNLARAMRHSLLLGGKRIRPLLVYLVSEMTSTPLSKILAPAAAVEMIHAYSLVHDDLPAMDGDTLRRGQPTCHIAFDEATAVLAGDALQALAFSLLAEHTAVTAEKRLAMLNCLSQAAGYHGMCAGQAIDIAAVGQTQTLKQLETMHWLKTGSLIQASVRLGAIAAGIDEKVQRQALDDYAKAIGLAFQVRDDILNVTGDSKTLGKPQGSDVRHDKKTYPSLLGLGHAQQKCESLRQQAINSLEALPYNTDKLALMADYAVQRNA